MAIDWAMIGPSPSTAASSSADAAITASSVPKWAASACAAAGPRCLMPSAVSSRGSGRWRDPSIAGEQLVGADLGEALEREQLLAGERVEVGGVGDQPVRGELADRALAEALDVHRPARGEVDDPLVALVRARRLDAAGVGLALEAHERAAERARARRRERPRPAASGPHRQHRADDLGDHVAGLAHDHRVARPDVLGAHLVLVVQRRHADRRAADEHRLEHGERRRPAGAADRHLDVAQQRRALLRRELVGDRPPRRPRRRAEPGALLDVVDLDDDAVDLVAEVVAVLLPVLAVGGDVVERVEHARPPG